MKHYGCKFSLNMLNYNGMPLLTPGVAPNSVEIWWAYWQTLCLQYDITSMYRLEHPGWTTVYGGSDHVFKHHVGHSVVY